MLRWTAGVGAIEEAFGLLAEVTHAIQQWADHYSIDLGEQSEGFFDRAYAGGPPQH